MRDAKLVLATMVSLQLAGCGLSANQRAAIGNFSNATKAAGSIAATEFVSTRAELITLRKRVYLFESGIVDPDDPNNDFDGPLDLDQAETRVTACAALETYGQLLSTMSTSDRTEELSSASTIFLTSLRRVPGVSISDAQAGALGELVITVGGAMIEANRARVIRDVVEQTGPSVDRVIELLRGDFSFNQGGWLHAVAATQVSIDSTIGRSIELMHDQKKIGGRTANADEIARRDSDYKQLKLDAQSFVQRLQALQPQFQASLTEFGKAHMALRYVMQSSDIDIVAVMNAYVERVERLITLVKILDA